VFGHSLHYKTLSGDIPYADVRSEFKVMKMVINGQFPTRSALAIPFEAEKEMWELLEECWIYQANRRPSASWVAMTVRIQDLARGLTDVSNFTARSLPESLDGGMLLH
jgi:hypothetical protein